MVISDLKIMGGNYYYTNNLDHNHTFDAGAGYKVVMEIKNNWRTKGLYVDDGAYIFDRLGLEREKQADPTGLMVTYHGLERRLRLK